MIDQNPSNITDICEIGRGLFGISHVITKSNNRFFVMKKLDENVKIKENCMKLIGKPNHPAIVKYIKYFKKIKQNDNPLIITDFYTKGSLFDFISLNKTKSKDFTFFTIDEEFTLSYFISKGLEYLHSNQIVHGNLTSKNILIDKKSHPHLDGFLYTRDYDDNDDDIEKIDFVLNYTAPEILKKVVESKKIEPTTQSDIYSFGMILYEILTGQSPFQEFDSFELLKEKIIGGLRPPTDTIFDPFVPIIESCWDPNPSNRPTAKEISSRIYEIANSLSVLRWFCSYGQSLNDISTTETNFDGFWKPLCKAGESNQSHVSMYIISIMCLNGSIQNPTEEENIGLKFLLVSSDSYEYAMKKVIEFKENGNIDDIEGFDIDEMKDIVKHFESRFANNLASIHYNLSIK